MKSVRIHLCVTCFLAILFAVEAVQAQSMNDPTRPPNATPEGESGQARVPVLQSVMITPHGRAAIINGERVELGGKFGDARVLKITETEVVLRSAGRTEVLKLYPNVDKAAKRPESRAARNLKASRE
jgi:MSHA biogenesis protein MshK